MIAGDLFLEIIDAIAEAYGQQPVSITVCKPTLHRLWRLLAQEQREERARKRSRRHKRALARRKQRGFA